MQVNELRVGNYYIYDGSEIKLDGSLLATYLQNDTDLYLYPIPLTEEWLLRFGFEKIEETYDEYTNLEYILVIDGYTAIIIQDDFSFGLENKNNPDESLCFTNDVVKSVHRLQNIYFALTGEELTINP